ncbi:hypothetical protein JQ604_15180 [Bradyrhizobium jicamae]|uniref:hypothetical protein n=1 Tax=Bradyrhizobium jicamae TaxID=280332 RepID=UPI001BA6626F|nr:hypothetical protein [Bradyrhizobium jicamae]MBR0753530.1 hypothetical protein [Bradyrhizobium jicamae]
MTVVLTPPNEQLRIDEVWLFVSIDENGEGLCAGPLMGPGTLVPLVAADKVRRDALMPLARQIAELSGKPVKVVKMSARTEEMTITPDGRPPQ